MLAKMVYVNATLLALSTSGNVDMEPALPNCIHLAIPFFLLLIAAEAIWSWRQGCNAYNLKDAAASLSMGLGELAVKAVQGGLVLTAINWVYQHRLFEIGYSWIALLAIFFADDLCYYWYHRLSHSVRLWWAAHVNHHSSEYFNFSTALRQSWTSGVAGVFSIRLLPLALLGFPPALIIFQHGLSLVYMFWFHTEVITRMPNWFEAVFNTPSHHRVHHASNPRYLNANFGGFLIIWDKLFGTFVPEGREGRIRYGLPNNINTYNPIRIAFHEWLDMLKDLRGARTVRECFMYVLGPPGWKSAPHGTAEINVNRVAHEYRSE